MAQNELEANPSPLPKTNRVFSQEASACWDVLSEWPFIWIFSDMADFCNETGLNRIKDINRDGQVLYSEYNDEWQESVNRENRLITLNLILEDFFNLKYNTAYELPDEVKNVSTISEVTGYLKRLINAGADPCEIASILHYFRATPNLLEVEECLFLIYISIRMYLMTADSNISDEYRKQLSKLYYALHAARVVKER